MNEVERYASYGKQPTGGITRPSFSKEDYQVRELFSTQLEDLGLSVSVDPIANVWGTLKGDGHSDKPIVLGSHLDTVPNGGKYDGALGVLVAKEIVQTLIDQQRTLKHPLQIVSFTAEEANEFNFATMGSRAFTGKLTANELSEAQNNEGLKLVDAVKKAGGDISQVSDANSKNLAAFFELHIEQGKKLEKQNLPVGVVNRIVGISRDIVSVDGEQNHSGTTMMTERKDALAAAGEMVATVQRLAKQVNTDAVATVGKFDVFPNAANIIPGRVEFVLEVRSADKQEREALVDGIHQLFEAIKEQYGVSVSIKNIYDTQEAVFDQELVELLEQSAKTIDVPYAVLPSMAGHDALHLAGVTKSAMLFVKSIKGISHNPEELSLKEDIEQSANVLLNAILLADEKLS
ncbi:Zn-dependent hydrolase [Planococcus salinus]|uniref:Zn-dependent hydrolase n=2 Tax=Planococcus salinus TaxID=1848460 RepID=A0A3M8P9L9_9BACL|nr:Zn-dependent hydrolase [Planococcus salinus]